MKKFIGKFLVLTAALVLMGSNEAQASRYFSYWGCTNFEGGGSMVYKAECLDRQMPGMEGTNIGNVFSCTGWTYTYTAVSSSSCPVN